MNTRAITQNKKVVTFGEVMLRLTAPNFQRFSQTNEFIATYGGSEANVAISLVNFGIPILRSVSGSCRYRSACRPE